MRVKSSVKDKVPLKEIAVGGGFLRDERLWVVLEHAEKVHYRRYLEVETNLVWSGLDLSSEVTPVTVTMVWEYA